MAKALTLEGLLHYRAEDDEFSFTELDGRELASNLGVPDDAYFGTETIYDFGRVRITVEQLDG